MANLFRFISPVINQPENGVSVSIVVPPIRKRYKWLLTPPKQSDLDTRVSNAVQPIGTRL